MERLTERLENGVINVKYASQHETAIHRLVTIEDILGDEYDLDELKEMVQAKREGRCMVLPAPLGSQVWQLKYPTRIDKNGEEWVICAIKEATVEPAPFGLTLSMVNQIGKIYWLSKEEAEAALRREQDEKGGDSE